MSMSAIPSSFKRLFQWICKPELFEELQGDLEEGFEENALLHGEAKAKNIYRKEILKMIRPSVLKGIKPMRFNQTILFKNYFKTSYRSMIKNPLSSFINVFGLAVAIGISIVVYTFFEYDYSIDRFHTNKDEVYLTTSFVNRDGIEKQYGVTPTPLGEMLREDFAQIKRVCRIEDRNVVMKYWDKVFHEEVRYTDPEFLQLFTFPLKWGIANSLKGIDNIVLSEKMSIKYFGDENPVGQNIEMIFVEGLSKNFTISGVSAEFPKAHIIEFDFLINFQNLRASDPNYNLLDWGGLVNATLIQVKSRSDLITIQDGMEKYRKLQNEVHTDRAISSFSFEPLSELHINSGHIRGGISQDGNAEARMGLPIIVIIMLTLACLNYINMAIVSSTKRLKEIGLRKVIGANKLSVAVQFLTENILVTFFALLIGIILSVTVFIPWLNEISGWPLKLVIFEPHLWVFLISILLFTGIASGIYPALYISKFEAVKIFKGSIRFGKKNTLTKMFLAIQLILTCGGITCAVLVAQNNTYQNNRSWGYNQKESLYVEVQGRSAFEQLRSEVSQNPNVLSISGSSHHLGKETTTAVIQLPDRKYEVRQLSVDANYFETMGIELNAGRVFKPHRESDRLTIIINEMMVENMVLLDPIGQKLKIDTTKFEVIGVVKDFHMYNFYDQIRPTMFRVADDEEFHYLSLKVRDGSKMATHNSLKTIWASLFPEIPFQGGFQEDVWTGFFEQVNTVERFYRALALVAILLASLGLYGLITLNVTGRIKEFSIRKALGAGVNNLTLNVGRPYLILFSVSLIIGLPFSYLFGKASMDMLYAYPMPITYSGMIISLGILLLVLLVVISTQIRKVIQTSPVKGLRTE